MNRLSDFLLDRISEDEELALSAAGWNSSGEVRDAGRWERSGLASVEREDGGTVIFSDAGQVDQSTADYIAHFDPYRIQAEVETKRRIIRLHGRRAGAVGAEPAEMTSVRCAECAAKNDPCPTLRALAVAYVDHPDFREEWAL